jgi:hypothetical protein
MTVIAQTLDCPQNESAPGVGITEGGKLYQPALGSARDEARGVPHFAHASGLGKRGVS